MIVEHFDALKSRLMSHSFLVGKVFDTARVGTSGLIRDNYVILMGGVPESLDDDRFTSVGAPTSKAEFLYTTRMVGTTTAAVRGFTQAVIDQCQGHVLAVPGRVCGPMRLDDAGTVVEDRNVSPSLFYADIDWVLLSTPA